MGGFGYNKSMNTKRNKTKMYANASDSEPIIQGDTNI